MKVKSRGHVMRPGECVTEVLNLAFMLPQNVTWSIMPGYSESHSPSRKVTVNAFFDENTGSTECFSYYVQLQVSKLTRRPNNLFILSSWESNYVLLLGKISL